MDYCVYCMSPLEGRAECPNCKKKQADYKPMPHHLQPGQLLCGKYLIGSVIGEGGFGITYIGRDITLEMKVAVKEYYPSGIVTRNNSASQEISAFVGDAEKLFSKGKTSFLKEARTLAKFSSDPSCVSVRDFFEENKTAYIVMEYLEGIDLKEYLDRSGKMNFTQMYTLLNPVMKTLGKVHSQGLIHRDISPSNIMVLADGSAKLLDFGAARDYLSENEKSFSIMLKPGFAPEEQYRTKGYQGPWTDIYALSATVYKLLTNVTPEDSMNRVFSDDVKPVNELNPEITKKQAEAIKKGMSVKAEERYQNMDEMIAAFDKCVEKSFAKSKTKTETGTNITIPLPTNSAQNTAADSGRVQKAVLQTNVKPKPADKKDKRKSVLAVAASLVIIALVAGGLISRAISNSKTAKGSMTISQIKKEVSVVIDEGNYNEFSNILKNKKIEDLTVAPGTGLKDSDIRIISELPTLRKLVISGNPAVTSLRALEDCPNLLWIEANDLPGLSVEELPVSKNIRSLSLERCGITTLRWISEYPNLDELSLSGNDLSSVALYVDFSNINSLDISDCNLSRLPFSSDCKGPMTLDASYNQILSLDNITDNSGLQYVDLSHNDISNLSPLHECFNIQSLDISYNSVSDISVLEYIDALENISLAHNKIRDASVFIKCEKLKEKCKELDISFNELENLNGIDRLGQLKNLYLNNNLLTSIDGIDKLIFLENLNLDGNRLFVSESYETDLHDTSISMDIGVLSKLTELRSLNLVGNDIRYLPFAENVFTSSSFKIHVYVTYNELISWERLSSNKDFVYYVRIVDVDSDRTKAELSNLGYRNFITSDEYYSDLKAELSKNGISFTPSNYEHKNS